MRKKLVVIGGGTGSFTLLSELKKHPFEITAIVNMADSGGSTGVLRDELGVLPPGDIRQCLVALSESTQTLRDLFNYRFPKGTTFAGHSFGNLFLSAFEDMSGDFANAIQLAEKVLDIQGKVVPVTLDDCHLAIETSAGQLKGEHNITKMHFQGDRPLLSLTPNATLNPDAALAIKLAEAIVIAPGNLYSSLAPNLLVKGMKKALAQSTAKKIYVCNLVNKPGQTDDFTVADYADEIERIAEIKFLDYVLFNNERPTKPLLHKYEANNEFPVLVDYNALKSAHYAAIGDNFLSNDPLKQNKNDTLLKRSLIRHNSKRVCKTIISKINF